MFPSLMTIPAALLDGSRATGRRHVAGIDGGATKTVAAVLSLDTFDLRFGHGGPSNVDAVGVAAAASAIRDALREALGEAGVDAGAVGTAVIGLAGTPSEELAESVGGDFAPGVASYFVNDVIAAWASGTWLEPGVAVISGTGSHVFGVNAAGESWRTGGWGHILGDEGSGYWLGLSGMRAALRYRDGSGPETVLLDSAVAFYQLEAVEDLQPLVYGKPLTKREIAAFTEEVEKAATAGDRVAAALYETAARELAAQTRAPIEKLRLDGAFKVALVGGVFASGELLRKPFEASVQAFAPRAQFVVPEIPPVGGSLLLGLRAEGVADDYDRDALRAALSGEMD
ncbi:MAG: BadF/BadG/BcrA/BcrD ATPase family protein [Verrucomicrobiota bacterium]